MTPHTSLSSGPAPAAANDALLKLYSQVGSAASAFQQTLHDVLGALDRQAQEMQSLRQSLAHMESQLRTQAPAAAEVVKPATSARIPSTPMMTQILWPSKESDGGAEAPASIKPKTNPISLVESMLHSTAPLSSALPPLPTSPFQPPPLTEKRPLTPPPAPLVAAAPSPASSASVMHPSYAPAAPVATSPLSPILEQATLEELNAALAYAFSQVAGNHTQGAGSVTQMMPAPLPTQAMRFGQAPDYAAHL